MMLLTWTEIRGFEPMRKKMLRNRLLWNDSSLLFKSEDCISVFFWPQCRLSQLLCPGSGFQSIWARIYNARVMVAQNVLYQCIAPHRSVQSQFNASAAAASRPAAPPHDSSLQAGRCSALFTIRSK
eukprot:3402901-Amphidinium_carterae.1